MKRKLKNVSWSPEVIFKGKCNSLFFSLFNTGGNDINFQTKIVPIKKCIEELSSLLPPINKEEIIDDGGYGPLHYAAIFGDLPFFQFCLKQGYSLSQETKNQLDVTQIALGYNSTNIIKYLKANNLVNLENYSEGDFIIGDTEQSGDDFE